MRNASAHPDPSATPARSGRETRPYVIASALRTLEVLRTFGRPPHQFGLADVIADLGIERNQAYRSLKTLEAAGYLVSTDDARYEIGPVAAELATGAARYAGASLLDAAGPQLDRLSEATSETVHLFMRAGDRAICVDKRDSTQSVRLVSVLGRAFPLHAGAVPKAMLAVLPDAERERIVAKVADLPRYTDRTVVDPDRLRAQLAAIRERGYSVSDEDFDASARGVGAAIVNADGTVVGGISVGGPSFRVDDDALDRFAQLVRVAAADTARRLALTGTE